jgi:hypothetical protein
VFFGRLLHDNDVVNVFDLVVRGGHGGAVDVSIQGHIVVDNNFV